MLRDKDYYRALDGLIAVSRDLLDEQAEQEMLVVLNALMDWESA